MIGTKNKVLLNGSTSKGKKIIHFSAIFFSYTPLKGRCHILEVSQKLDEFANKLLNRNAPPLLQSFNQNVTFIQFVLIICLSATFHLPPALHSDEWSLRSWASCVMVNADPPVICKKERERNFSYDLLDTNVNSLPPQQKKGGKIKISPEIPEILTSWILSSSSREPLSKLRHQSKGIASSWKPPLRQNHPLLLPGMAEGEAVLQLQLQWNRQVIVIHVKALHGYS